MDKDNNIIDFEKEKNPFVLKKKEAKLKTLQKAFKQALPLDKATKKPKKKPHKRK